MDTSIISDTLRAVELFLREADAISKTRILSRIEKRLEKAMKRAFALQHRAFMRHFESIRIYFVEAIRDNDWMPLFGGAALETLESFVNPIDTAAREALFFGGKRAFADLGISGSFELTNPRAITYLDNYGAKMVANINETTRGYLKTVVTEGAEKGWSYDKTAKAITDRYQEFRIGKPQLHIDSRAHFIAVTETGNAYEEGNMIVAQDLKFAGLEMEKSWLTVGDDRVSVECILNQDDGWIPLGQVFSGGVDRPLQHPGCRCTMLTRRKGG